jgi:3-dehydroquinate synthase
VNELASAITISSAQGIYSVDFIAGLAELDSILRGLDRAFWVVDENVSRLYRSQIPSLDRAPLHLLEATEHEKTLDGVQRVLSSLQSAGGNKKTVIVALGGGIVQDVTALSAKLWFRGVSFIFVPTTLLAMADSCIGAKCAVNFGEFKNQVGTFSAPDRILLCDAFLKSLADEDVISGYGEILKLAIIESETAVASLREAVAREGFRGQSTREAIRRSLLTKRRFIEIDEFDQGVRRILNYGHTFGHALENVSRHTVPHGIAVLKGIDIANYTAYRLGLAPRAFFDDVHALIVEWLAHTTAIDIDPRALLTAMSRDKKAIGGSVSLILPSGFGDVNIHEVPLDLRLQGIVADYNGTVGPGR